MFSKIGFCKANTLVFTAFRKIFLKMELTFSILVPDQDGNVRVYKKFWNQEEQQYFPDDQVVHPLLAYGDLMNTGDRRCAETAEKIYQLQKNCILFFSQTISI